MQKMLKDLFQSATILPKVGVKTYEALLRLGLNRVIDLIQFKPVSVIQYKLMPKLAHLQEGDHIIAKVQIAGTSGNSPNSNSFRKKLFQINCYNDTGFIKLNFFNYYPYYLDSKISENKNIMIKGRVEKYMGFNVITHPEIINKENFDLLEVIYPLTYGITNKQLINIIDNALKFVPDFEEWLPENIIKQYNFISFNDAIKRLHHPKTLQEFNNEGEANKRLAFDELFASQLAIKLMRNKHNKEIKGQKLSFTSNLKNRVLQELDFVLTFDQEKVIAEIEEDQRSEQKMMRLVQGDVGSGKTVIALVALLNVVESSFQGCFMAPTDLLAKQQYNWISKVTRKLCLRVVLLTSKIKNKEKKEIYQKLKNHEIDILIGTHSVFQENVSFANLALIVIDEQHRFGVEQRLALSNKNPKSDILIMSATPIPRTLTMALYGDIKLSIVKQKPANRKPIITKVMPISREKELIESLKNLIAKNEKIYWVCPLIEEKDEAKEGSTKKNLKSVISRYNELRSAFGDVIGLVHGKMGVEEKELVMENFLQGNIKILVATTIIEVGIDVKDATLIVIEHAECFGLSQLHQLRGRVGRGDKQSYCVLLYHKMITAESKSRLSVMRRTNDGFVIAKEDLKLRGSGKILGTKQSGLDEFKFFDFVLHSEMFSQINDLAENILNSYPLLQESESFCYKKLLYLFSYHQTVKYLEC